MVGCGISGAVLARKIAEELNQQVFVIDSRNHIGGNCFDYRDADSKILVQKYGPHIFHTDNAPVWNFLSRFTKWHLYQHKVLGQIDGRLAPIPFNLNSLQMLLPDADKLEARLIKTFGLNANISVAKLRGAGDKDLADLAEYIYEKVFSGYTAKQWGISAAEINPVVLDRVPVRISRDARYFLDTYQGIPAAGYTDMISNILNHKNIKVFLNTKFNKDMKYGRLFWTGSIDEFFDCRLGILPYRSERIEFAKLQRPQFQPAACVNYPCDYSFTRITEYKQFLNDKSNYTIISYEYPGPFLRGRNQRMYPIENEENLRLYAQYVKLAQDYPNTWFLGRLGDYKYYDMDDACARAMSVFEEIKGR
ncbi:MAG: UDP-galactopyranose mutase [Rickettsiales bacterium]|nr:UDP-galactopyranose mutase [Rickettsiales bacterium]